MGFVFAVGGCYICKRVFAFNPEFVPSYNPSQETNLELLKITKGKPEGRQPICKTCILRANELRLKNGLEPLVIHPQAYELAEGY